MPGMWRRQGRLREGVAAARRLAGMLFPEACLLCGTPLEYRSAPSYPICPACVAGLHGISPPTCGVCGLPLVSETDVCTRCRERDYSFTSNIAAFTYRGAAKELLYQYKFAGHRRVAAFLAEVLAGLCRDSLPREVILVPAPPRRGYRRRRGWEHVQEIVRILEKRHSMAVCRCLIRSGPLQQKELDFQSRWKNLAGSMVVHRRPPHRDLVVVDDVFTTGATLHECARVLLQAGAPRVHGLTVAIDE